MKNLSLLIIRFALLEDWICALAVMTHVNIEWVTALLLSGLGRIIIIQGRLIFSGRILNEHLSMLWITNSSDLLRYF